MTVFRYLHYLIFKANFSKTLVRDHYHFMFFESTHSDLHPRIFEEFLGNFWKMSIFNRIFLSVFRALFENQPKTVSCRFRVVEVIFCFITSEISRIPAREESCKEHYFLCLIHYWFETSTLCFYHSRGTSSAPISTLRSHTSIFLPQIHHNHKHQTPPLRP